MVEGKQEALGFQPKADLSRKRGAALLLNAFQSLGYYIRLGLLVMEVRPMLKLTTGLIILE